MLLNKYIQFTFIFIAGLAIGHFTSYNGINPQISHAQNETAISNAVLSQKIDPDESDNIDCSIATSYVLNTNHTTESASHELDNEGNGLVANLINLMANKIPRETLYSLVQNSTGYKYSELENMYDPIDFVGRFSQLATGIDMGYQEPVQADGMTIASFMVDNEFKAGDNLSVIKPEQTRIFVHFTLIDYEGNEVLVKWYYADTNIVLSFKRYPIKNEDSNHYVWLDNKNGWLPGNYNVEIYSSDESLILLSTGNYYVSD